MTNVRLLTLATLASALAAIVSFPSASQAMTPVYSPVVQPGSAATEVRMRKRSMKRGRMMRSRSTLGTKKGL